MSMLKDNRAIIEKILVALETKTKTSTVNLKSMLDNAMTSFNKSEESEGFVANPLGFAILFAEKFGLIVDLETGMIKEIKSTEGNDNVVKSPENHGPEKLEMKKQFILIKHEEEKKTFLVQLMDGEPVSPRFLHLKMDLCEVERLQKIIKNEGMMDEMMPIEELWSKVQRASELTAKKEIVEKKQPIKPSPIKLIADTKKKIVVPSKKNSQDKSREKQKNLASLLDFK